MNIEASSACPFPYKGPSELQKAIVSAPKLVVDPEVALSIVDLGLVYGVEIAADGAGDDDHDLGSLPNHGSDHGGSRS